MPRNVSARVLAGMLGGVLCGLAVVPPAPADEVETAQKLWRQMRLAEPHSAEFMASEWKLTAMLGTLAQDKRIEVAAGMMDRTADLVVNATALRMFGKDPLPLADIQRILADPARAYPQRVLLKTYYCFCRSEENSSVLTENARRLLAGVLAERVEKLAAAEVPYGEQRLLTHLTTCVLDRYARQGDDVPQAKALLEALAKYADGATGEDGFGAAIPVWLDLARSRQMNVDTFGKAVQALGHWSPLSRLEAAARLGEDHVPTDAKAAQVVLGMLADPRDEARAAAARVFAIAKNYRPDRIVPEMVQLLTRDRGVVVQAAAAEVLVARRDQAAGQVDTLLAAANDPMRRLGAGRTSNILLVLSKLADTATPAQKQGILTLAVRDLTRSPAGALAALQALGPQALKAVPSIREYRATADYLRRTYIDRHVLPAILPETE